MHGNVAEAQIPPTLAAGNYLIRTEIIALHLAATEEGKVEFCVSCSQLRVGGNKTGVPKSTDLVSLPGVYKDSDLVSLFLTYSTSPTPTTPSLAPLLSPLLTMPVILMGRHRSSPTTSKTKSKSTGNCFSKNKTASSTAPAATDYSATRKMMKLHFSHKQLTL